MSATVATRPAAAFQISPLSPRFAAEVVGLDLRQPLVRIHPDTGRKSLFMGEHASHLDGMPMAEGRARILELEKRSTQDRFTYRHKWRAGDLLMWDNRCLLHRADPNFDAALHPRVLHRTCLRGTAPL